MTIRLGISSFDVEKIELYVDEVRMYLLSVEVGIVTRSSSYVE